MTRLTLPPETHSTNSRHTERIMQQNAAGPIPMRQFGRHQDVKVSALALGGHHLGDPDDEKIALQIVHEALDGGITFFDNCWEYHRGKSEEWLGAGLKGRRDQAFLMTKVCTHGRDKQLALQMLEQSLHRLHTDHLDLWQIHGVSFENDPELFIRPNGAAEALHAAKQQGKVRFVGFTGHKDPQIHLAMLKTGFPFDAIQMPLNPFDSHFHSFEQLVLPEARKQGLAVLGMKPMCGTATPIHQGAVSAEEALRYAMSLPVTTTIAGVEKIEILHHHLRIAQGFQPMQAAEMDALRARTREMAGDGHFELYKVSMKYDNPEARISHDYPLDMQQKEVKEMLGASQNDGKPYPKYSPPTPQ